MTKIFGFIKTIFNVAILIGLFYVYSEVRGVVDQINNFGQNVVHTVKETVIYKNISSAYKTTSTEMDKFIQLCDFIHQVVNHPKIKDYSFEDKLKVAFYEWDRYKHNSKIAEFLDDHKVELVLTAVVTAGTYITTSDIISIIS